MRLRLIAVCCALMFTVVPTAAEDPVRTESPQRISLQRTSLTQLPDLAGLGYGDSLCDSDGNLYYRVYDESSGDATPYRRFTPADRKLLTFVLSNFGEKKFEGFTSGFVDASSQINVLAWSREGWYVVTFDSKGAVKTATKIAEKLQPAQLGVFPKGEILISGLKPAPTEENRAATKPFTGIFDSAGKLVRDFGLADDEALATYANRGDARYSNPVYPGTNRAVSFGRIFPGAREDLLVTRFSNPVLAYSVVASGDVTGRLEIPASDMEFQPIDVQANGSRVAVLFESASKRESEIVVGDVQTGEIVQRYVLPNRQVAFLCYQTGPDRFSFMATKDGKRAVVQFAP